MRTRTRRITTKRHQYFGIPESRLYDKLFQKLDRVIEFIVLVISTVLGLTLLIPLVPVPFPWIGEFMMVGSVFGWILWLSVLLKPPAEIESNQG